MQTPTLLFLGDIGGSELMLIMVVILIFFGANKIPELARGLGKGIREFKDASTEIRREFEQSGQPTQPNPGYAAQQPNPAYGAPHPHPAPLPLTPSAETSSGFDPWAAPAGTLPTADAPYEAPTLPPNLAPEGSRPRQPYPPTSSEA